MVQCWLADSLRRFYPATPVASGSHIHLHLLRGERGSFQMVFRTRGTPAMIEARVTGPEPIFIRVRHAGCVPMPHINTETLPEEIDGIDFLPGLVPDVLFEETSVLVGPYETTSFWVSVHVPPEIAAGEYQLDATFLEDGSEIASFPVSLTVHPTVLPDRRDFPVTNWLYADAIADWYKVDLFDEPFWRLLNPFLSNLVSHGQDTIFVPLLTPSTDGVKRPVQLLRVEQDGDRYTFEWSQVERWLRAARGARLEFFEWPHLFSQWGAAYALRVYRGNGESGELLWAPETGATSDVYRNFLADFLPAFERFLRAQGVIERSFFHLSDEPHGAEHLANYRAARQILREIAPWIRVMDAMSEIEFAREGSTDTPIALLPAVPDFLSAGFPVWAYFCCQPRGHYLNRLFDTPLAKIRMSGWLFYRTGVRGFLHWGYNYWYRSQTTELIDPFQVADAVWWPTWAYGDPFVVYPGPSGPLDSIRWEVFAESLQDYALLQASRIAQDDPLLAEIKDFATFPRDPEWIGTSRDKLIARLQMGE